MIYFTYIVNELWFIQQSSTHAPTYRKWFRATHIDIYCSNILTPKREKEMEKK